MLIPRRPQPGLLERCLQWFLLFVLSLIVLAYIIVVTVVYADDPSSVVTESYRDERGRFIEYQGYYQPGCQSICAVGDVYANDKPSHCLGGWCGVLDQYMPGGVAIASVHVVMPSGEKLPLGEPVKWLEKPDGTVVRYGSELSYLRDADPRKTDIEGFAKMYKAAGIEVKVAAGTASEFLIKWSTRAVATLGPLLWIPDATAANESSEIISDADALKAWVSPLTPKQQADMAVWKAWLARVDAGLPTGGYPGQPGVVYTYGGTTWVGIGYSPSLGGNGGWDKIGVVIVGPVTCLSGC